MALWLNHAAIAAARNGTATHTVNPASTGTVVAGSAFTPTAGRLLVCAVEGAVTTTGTAGGGGGTAPTGWTLPTGGSAVNNTGLYVFHKNAAGSDTLVGEHNGSNYPCMFHFFEFPAGSTFVSSVSGTALSDNTANPNLTGLTGTNLAMAAKARGNPTDPITISGAWSGATELIDYDEPYGSSTDGYWYSLAYSEDYAGASFQPTCTVTQTAGGTSYEALTWAVNVAASFTRTQEGFRWRADDGDEDGATWLAAQDSNP